MKTSERAVTVVKLGGAATAEVERFCEDAAACICGGMRLVVVHGGSEDMNRLSERLGEPVRFITSPSGHVSRRTDAGAIDVMRMACRGLLNQRIVTGLQARGVNAVGLSGVDGRVWEGTRKGSVRAVEGGRTVVIRDDYTGVVERVNAGLVRWLVEAGYTPVLCPPAISTENEAINVDADRAAAMTAKALGAGDLLLLTNVAGLMRSYPDESTVIARLSVGEAVRAAECAQGRMKKKVLGAVEALEGGVGRVVISDARRERPIAAALAGEGTVFQ